MMGPLLTPILDADTSRDILAMTHVCMYSLDGGRTPTRQPGPTPSVTLTAPESGVPTRDPRLTPIGGLTRHGGGLRL